MIHTIRYFGHFEHNFRRLEIVTATYSARDGEEKPVAEVSASVTGFRFRYMECPNKEFVAVGVEQTVLRAPVLLIPERHTDGKGFFADPLFEDNSAMRLLVDIIIANPERRDVIGRLLRRLEP